MEPEKDMENFVRDYGTGNQIPDPPAFVNFSDPNAIPTSSSRPTFRPSNFPRSSQRPPPMRRNSAQPEEDEPTVNTAGVGVPHAVRRGDEPNAGSISRQNTQSRRTSAAPTPEQQQQPLQQQHTNGFSPTTNGGGAVQDVSRQPTTRKSVSPSYRVPPRDPLAEPIDPNADTFIKVGPNAYKVDLSKDPTQAGPSSSRVSLSSSPQNGGFDPLAKQMQELETAGTIRRKNSSRGTQSRRGQMDAGPSQNPRPSSSMSLVAPVASSSAATITPNQQRSHSPSPSRDYRHSAEAVVGTHPSASRPASPNPAPITAAFMRPTSAAGPPPGAELITDVLTDYHQSLPGERKSVSRSNSRRGSYTGAPPGAGHAYNASQGSQHAHGQSLARPPSQVGFAGIGTPGGSRSSSPQPMSMSRGPSPAPVMANVRQSFIAPPPAASSMSRQGAASPNNVGIALDPSGRVMHDEMAQRYQQQQQQQQRQMPPQQAPPPQSVYNPHAGPHRRLSYMSGGAAVPAPPPPQQPAYGAMTPYQPQPGYVAPPPPPPLQPAYTPAPAPYQPPPPQQQQVYQPQPHASAYNPVNGLQHRMSTGGAGGGWQQSQQPHQQQLVRAPQQQQQQLVRAPQQQMQLQPQYQPPVRRSPSPSPQPGRGDQPQQQTSDGKWILFYGAFFIYLDFYIL
jgi:hypothetical protein